MNGFELDRRLAKVRRIIEILDYTFSTFQEGLPEAQLMYVEKANEEAWQSIARVARVNVPSDETRRMVIAEYYARVQRAEVSRCIAASLRAAVAP